MAEGDTILRAAESIGEALCGQLIRVRAPNPRGRAAGVERLDGQMLLGASARGKHLLLDFDELILHSHLGMSGSWALAPLGPAGERASAEGPGGGLGRASGDRAGGRRGAAWAVLRGERAEATQRGGPTLRVLRSEQLSRDPVLSRLGPDILAADFQPEVALASLRRADPAATLGEVLLDQRLLAGVGNVFKSEGCFAAAVDPWTPVGEATDEELVSVLGATRDLMRASAAGRSRAGNVYRRAGRPCPRCGAAIVAAGQGDANRRTYWCGSCQAPKRGPTAAPRRAGG